MRWDNWTQIMFFQSPIWQGKVFCLLGLWFWIIKNEEQHISLLEVHCRDGKLNPTTWSFNMCSSYEFGFSLLVVFILYSYSVFVCHEWCCICLTSEKHVYVGDEYYHIMFHNFSFCFLKGSIGKMSIWSFMYSLGWKYCLRYSSILPHLWKNLLLFWICLCHIKKYGAF